VVVQVWLSHVQQLVQGYEDKLLLKLVEFCMPWQVCGRAAGHLQGLQPPWCATCGCRKKEWISELLRPLGGWHYEKRRCALRCIRNILS
jgi:hypothetical protein